MNVQFVNLKKILIYFVKVVSVINKAQVSLRILINAYI